MVADIDNHIRLPTTVVVAMSGGVDSSLAAVLLKKQGYEIIGLTMRLWHEDDGDDPRCGSHQALADARAVCQQWHIPHVVLDLQEVFHQAVVEPFIQDYLRGRTPNPCVVCNVRIKWNILLREARSRGAEALATGHYARVRWNGRRGRFLLLRGKDKMKDQSYALWGLSQTALSRTILPLGDLTKEQARHLARQLDLKVAAKRDSQEICFISDDDYGRFLQRKVSTASTSSPRRRPPWSPGPIVDRQGKVLGHHRGIPFYTIGQRRGLGLSAGRPLYVLDINPTSNRLVVGTNDELLTHFLWAHHCNWVSISPPDEPMSCMAQIRYNHRAAPATLIPLPTGDIEVIFHRPQRAITPGQSVVLYRRDELLGGGLIRRPSAEELACVSQVTFSGAQEGTC